MEVPEYEAMGAIPWRLELLLVLGALAAGSWLRFHDFFQIGLSHHDEGVYAISSMAPTANVRELADLLVSQGLYSPPGYPLLSRLACWALGAPSPFGVLTTSACFSLALMVLLWWVGRNWWSPVVGVLACWLAALDGMQVIFARVGLTDSTFAFFFVAGVWLGKEAIVAGNLGRCVAAGLACGFGWLVKYNGFLPLLLLAGLIQPADWKVGARRWLLIVGIAVLCYLPWAVLFHVKHPGGYTTLMRHQSGYFLGPAAVVSGWWIAWINDAAVRTAASGVPAAAILAPFEWAAAAVGVAFVFAAGSTWALALFAPLAVLGIRSAKDRATMRAAWWSAAWLLILPAMYTPYFRLWLPTASLGLLAVAAGVVAMARSAISAPKVVPAMLAFGLIAFFTGSPRRWTLPFAAAAGYRPAALEIQSLIENQRPPRVLALVRPPLRLYLAGAPVSYLDGATFPDIQPGDWLMMDRTLTDSDRRFQETWSRVQAADRVERVAVLPVDACLPALLDDVPGLIAVESEAPEVQVWRAK